MGTASYRERKVAFVSNTPGSSVWTICSVVFTCVTTQMLWHALQHRTRISGDDKPSTLILQFSVEFITLVAPWIVVITIQSASPFQFNMFIFVLAVAIKKDGWWWDRIARVFKGAEFNSSSSNWPPHYREILELKESAAGGAIDDKLLGYQQQNSVNSLSPTTPASMSSHTGFDASIISTYTPHYHRHTPSADNERYNLAKSPLLPRSPTLAAQGSSVRLNGSFTSSNSRSNTASSQEDSARMSRPLPYRIFTKPFVSVYRAQLLLLTALCILAVDFPAFPRAFAKCETWGTSLMDLGVGGFVFSYGLVWILPNLRNRVTAPLSFSQQFLSAFKKSFPLFILGLLRLILVKSMDYHEHMTEYGVHWNFFFTLGLLPLIAVPLSRLCGDRWHAHIAILCTLLHQVLLKNTNLESYIISSSPRHGLIDQNKEGIFSLPGYVAIFLLGADTGMYVLPPDPYFAYRDWKHKTPFKPKLGKLATVLAGYGIMWWVAYFASNVLWGEPVSRRLANLPYVLWTAAMNVSSLLCLLLVQLAWGSPKMNLTSSQSTEGSLLIDAINRNGMIYFLLANVMTGLVNFTMFTVDVNNFVAVLILTYYGVLLNGGIQWWWVKHRRNRRGEEDLKKR